MQFGIGAGPLESARIIDFVAGLEERDLIAHRFDLDDDLAALAITLSIILAFFTLPGMLWLLGEQI